MQPLDFTVLSEAAATPVPHRETTETLYKLSQIVCVKARIPVILLNCPLNCSYQPVCKRMWASAWRGWKPKCSFKIFSIQCCPRKMRRDILRYVQHCLSHNQLWLPWRYLRTWRRWGYSSPWCASTYQWSCHYRRGSWDSLDDRNCSRRRTAWADSMEKKQAVWKRFFSTMNRR